MKYFSLFSGIGGLDYGLKDFAECVGISEINKDSLDIYQKRMKDIKNYGDITKINIKTLPHFDLLIGGFPCQTFSVAGLRKGFKERKGKMIFYIYDIIKEKQPKFIILENVKGIISHNKGKTFRSVIKLLSAQKYYVRVILLNSLYYGSAQVRERIFFLASKLDFKIKMPEIRDFTKRFRDIRDYKGKHIFIKKTKYNLSTLNQEREFNFELIGGYDRVGTLITQRGCGKKAVYEEEKDDYRYLTLLECERLQGFPEYESYINIKIHNNICQLDLQKSYVNVEKRNHKLQDVAKNAEKEDLKESVLFVKKNLSINNQQTNKLVQENVLINCEEGKVQIHNRERLLEYANYVINQKSFLQHIKKEDFAQMIVGINTICEKIINLGKVGLLQNDKYLIQVKNGKVLLKLFGKEMMQLVKDVKKDSTILEEHMKFIISNNLNIKDLDSKWITSFFYVISAIIGCILQKTEINNLLNLKIKIKSGYTAGKSDNKRCFMLGNAVNCFVSEYLIKDYLKGIWW